MDLLASIQCQGGMSSSDFQCQALIFLVSENDC